MLLLIVIISGEVFRMSPEEIAAYTAVTKNLLTILTVLGIGVTVIVNSKINKKTMERLVEKSREFDIKFNKNHLVTVTNTAKIDGIDTRVKLLENA